jgi:hypothetical protein
MDLPGDSAGEVTQGVPLENLFEDWEPPAADTIVDDDDSVGVAEASHTEAQAPDHQQVDVPDDSEFSASGELDEAVPFGVELDESPDDESEDDFGFDPGAVVADNQAADAADSTNPDTEAGIGASAVAPVTSGAEVQVRTASSDRQVVKPVFRPDLFGGGAVKPVARKRKAPRVKATPRADTLDVPSELAPGDLDPDIRNALDAAATVPLPVFSGDLQAAFGENATAAWEEEHKRDGTVFRFVSPKSRHRERGPLVVPQENQRSLSTDFAETPWGQCLDAYKGARLYEIGVVLHTFGSQVVAHKIDPSGYCMQLKIKQSRGIVGGVCVTANDVSENSDARAAMRRNIKELLTAGVEMVVLAPTLDPIYDACSAAVIEDVNLLQWELTCPVVAARSWEWASGRTSVLQHLAG